MNSEIPGPGRVFGWNATPRRNDQHLGYRKDMVRTTCYLRDIDRDYAPYNKERTAFYREQGLDPLPASTGVGTALCRPDLLVEMDLLFVGVRHAGVY